MGVTIYQSVDITPEVARKFADFARHLPPRWLDRWRK
jgi:hypothetical protein